MKKPLSFLLTILSIAVFFIYEVHSPLALAIFVCGLVARKQFYKLLDSMDGRADSATSWMFQHAREYAKGLHPERNPLNCEHCLRRLS